MRRWQLLSPKRMIPVFLAGATGFFVLADFLQPPGTRFAPGLAAIAGEIVRWTIVLTAFALLVGVLAMVAHHLRRLFSRRPEALYSLALLLGFFLVVGAALSSQYPVAGTDPLLYPFVQDLFKFVYTPLSTSLLALLAFFGLTAALRALGSGRRDAIFLVLVAVVLLIFSLPFAVQLPAVGDIAAWIQNYLLLAGARALILGGAIGALVASVRILMGVDRPYLDR